MTRSHFPLLQAMPVWHDAPDFSGNLITGQVWYVGRFTTISKTFLLGRETHQIALWGFFSPRFNVEVKPSTWRFGRYTDPYRNNSQDTNALLTWCAGQSIKAILMGLKYIFGCVAREQPLSVLWSGHDYSYTQILIWARSGAKRALK